MSVASEITRLQGVKSDILQAIRDKGVTVPVGSALDDCPDLIASIGRGVEQIGDKQYQVNLMSDGKIWMCQNLDYGESGVYYNNDESTYGWNGLKYGKLYTWDEAVAAANEISGWHLATAAEWDALAKAVGGASVAGTKLKSTTGWNSDGNGTDDFGFAVFPAGYMNSGSFVNLGSLANFWTATEESSANAYRRYFDRGASMNSASSNKAYYAFSVRLVKD